MKRKTAFSFTSPTANLGEALGAGSVSCGASLLAVEPSAPKKKRPLPEGVIWWLSQPCHPVIQALGRVVFRERTDRGWSQRELAKVAIVGLATVCDVERGEIVTRVEVLLRLETAFGMKKNKLMDPAHQLLSAGG